MASRFYDDADDYVDEPVHFTKTFSELIAPRWTPETETERDGLERKINAAISPVIRNRQMSWVFAQWFSALPTDDFGVVKSLAKALRANGDLLKFRAVSEEVAAMFFKAGIFDSPNEPYQKLFMSPRYVNPERRPTQQSFEKIAHGCRELRVKMKERDGGYEFPPAMVFARNFKDEPTMNDWPDIFHLIPNLATLFVATDKTMTGVTWNRTCSALTQLRIAFENAGLQNVDTLRLKPMDMIYISYFHWKGPAFGSATSLAANAWSRITNLEVQILPPSHDLPVTQRIQVSKMFNAWLQSFAPTLKSLKFAWQEEQGLHPFSLMRDLDIRSRRQGEMRMPQLRELWVARCRDAVDARDLIETLMPKLLHYYVLVRGHSHAQSVAFSMRTSHELWQHFDYSPPAPLLQYPKPRATPERGNAAPLRAHPSPEPTWAPTPPSNSLPMLQYGKPSNQDQAIGTSQPNVRFTRDSTTSSATHGPPIPHRQTSTSSKSSSFLKAFGLGTPTSPTRTYDIQRHTSLPTKEKSKPPVSRVSSLFKKVQSRPKSEGNPRKPVITLVGETSPENLPEKFRSETFTLVADKMQQFREAGGVINLVPGGDVLENPEIGMNKWSPGTVIEAGAGAAGAKLPAMTANPRNGRITPAARRQLARINVAEAVKELNRPRHEGMHDSAGSWSMATSHTRGRQHQRSGSRDSQGHAAGAFITNLSSEPKLPHEHHQSSSQTSTTWVATNSARAREQHSHSQDSSRFSGWSGQHHSDKSVDGLVRSSEEDRRYGGDGYTNNPLNSSSRHTSSSYQRGSASSSVSSRKRDESEGGDVYTRYRVDNSGYF